MKQLAIAGVLAVALAPWALGADEAVKKDLKALEGTWQMEKQTADGKETEADVTKNVKVVFDAEGNWKVIVEDKTVLEGTVKLDPAKKPRTADWKVTTEGDLKDKVALGIYAVDGDTFKHCYAGPDKERPTKFESTEGSGVVFATFKRVKK